MVRQAKVLGTIGSILVLSLCSASLPAYGQAVPDNTWVKVSDESSGGSRAGLVYLPDQQGTLLFGYYPPGYARSDVSLFRTRTRVWEEQLVGNGPHQTRGTTYTVFKSVNGQLRPGLPCINRPYWLGFQGCYMPTIKKILYFAGAATFTYDPATRAWEDLQIPPDQAPPDVMLGSLAWDPVKKRVILFGGGYISAYKNSSTSLPIPGVWTPGRWSPAEKRATWAFDPAGRTWTKVVTGSAPYRTNFQSGLAFEPRLNDLIGAIRGIALEYGDWVTGKTPSELAGICAQVAADAGALAASLNSGGSCTDPYEVSQCQAAAKELDRAKSSLEQARTALLGGDGWLALRAAEQARRPFFEAAEAVAPSPLPRYDSRLVSDTRNNVLVLFGGHGGTMSLADTWVFDGAKEQWRRSRSAAHPPFNVTPATSYDSKAGLFVLADRAGTWLYDAARDEWRTVPTTGRSLLYPSWNSWAAMEYDPVEDLHVVLGADGSDPTARRVVLFRLNAAAAAAATSDSRIWTWMNGKYDTSWASLPTTQADYRVRVTAQKSFLDGLAPNVWTRRVAPYNAQDRSYGSFCHDWERNQLVLWGGGHSAYMGNEFSQYDVRSNLWMESWAPDLPPAAFGSPDGDGWNPPLYHVRGSAHGYHNYVYSSDLRRVVFGGSGLYDPDRMRWAPQTIGQQGPGSKGYAVDMSGSAGIFTASAQYYRGAPFGVWKADLSTMTLSRITGSDPPFASNDRAKAVFDSRRQRILWYGGGSQVNELYAFTLSTATWQKITPQIDPPSATPPKMMAWGNSYSARHDIMMIVPGSEPGSTWVYDCARNVLRNLGPGPVQGAPGTKGVIYDEKDDVFIAMENGSYGTGPVSLHFMRYTGGTVSPVITNPPANQTVTAGQTATFAVVATGTAPISYQWQMNGTNIAGATSSSYTTPATTIADNSATFRVIVTNAAGSATSSSATLTVTPAASPPAITTPPANQTVTAGQTATFTVVATGTAPLTYQWQKNDANIAGATSTSYTTPATTTADSGATFRVVVTNSAGSATSSAATLTVNVQPPSDTDSDGLPDSWETRHFGNLNQTAAGDPDGDGASNLQEYQGGTGPMDPGSRPSGGLPSPWVHQDIGAVGLAGSASYSNGTFTVQGAGAGLGGTADAFQIVVQPWSGDGELTIRVASFTSGGAGILFRESLAPDAAYAAVVLTSGGAVFQWRLSASGPTSESVPMAATDPTWLRLVRQGDALTGYVSTDGANWIAVGSQTVAMGSGAYVGVLVTSQNAAALAMASFDGVSVQAGTTMPPSPAPAGTPTSSSDSKHPGGCGIGAVPTTGPRALILWGGGGLALLMAALLLSRMPTPDR